MTEEDMPQPLKECLWLMKQFSKSKGEKREKYRKKIENWRKSYPEYVDFVLSALEGIE